MNNSKNRKLVWLLSTITILFLSISLYLIYFELFLAKDLNSHKYNSRNNIDEVKILRGSIFDRNGELITHSQKDGDKQYRVNKYNYLYSSIIGYNSEKYGKSGIELSRNAELLNTSSTKDIFDQIKDIYSNDNVGRDLYLTIDDRIQSYAYDLLNNLDGAIVVSKPSTGEIVAMVSRPSFNVNSIDENWNEVINSENAVMINRVTQGLYEPGSIFKVLTSMTFLDSNIDLSYNDTGSARIADYTVNNFENASYGNMDLEKALNVSSNTYFFEKSTDITNEQFLSTIENFGINQINDFGLNMSQSILAFKKGLSDLEKANAAFGQGKTYVTPIDMLMVANGIANDGIVNQPYLIYSVKKNNEEKKTEPRVLSSKVNADNTRLIRSYLKSTAIFNDYHLKSGVALAGKTGTAETNNNLNHLWYLGMAPADNPEYTIIVLVENSPRLAGEVAAPIAVKLLDYIFSLRDEN